MTYIEPAKKINQYLNVIIFSKNRPCQLDLLLNSMAKFFIEHKVFNTFVLYAVSDDEYQYGYDQLIKKHKKIKFIKEQNFKRDMLENINVDNKYTVFLVDDIVWKESFSVECRELELLDKDLDIICLSLRLDQYLTYCYACDIDMRRPEFDQQMRWQWDGQDGDFGYPMSLDGHIFRTEDIYPLLTSLTYYNPNSLEGELSQHPLNKSKMICLNKARLFNMPINKVQNDNSNRHGSITAEYLNTMFINGYRISLKQLIGYDNNACHQEVDITLKRPLQEKIKAIIRSLYRIKSYLSIKG